MPVSVSLLSFADDVVEKLRGHAPNALEKADATAVHQARVATRRMKSALTMFEPITSGSEREKFARVLKKLRKHLGPLRDVDVMLEHLSTLKGGNGALAWAIGEFSAHREKVVESTSAIDVPKLLARVGAWWGVRQQWHEAEKDLGCLIAESVHLQLDRFIENADWITKPADAPATADQSDPHQLRIAGKELRYTLEFAVASGHRLPARVTRAFRNMQDELGLWHDYVVLADELMKRSHKSQLALHHAGLQLEVLGLIKTVLKRSQRQIARFCLMWNKRGGELTDTIRQAFPLTQGVSESETGHDPADLEQSVDSPAATAQAEPTNV